MRFLKDNLPYDSSNLDSVFKYALQLEEKSLRVIVSADNLIQEYKGKGGFGNKVEELFFFIENNSDAMPDLQEIGLEIKTTPIKQIKKGLVSKERLVFNIINFNEEHKESFKTSSFWKKNKLLLLIFYLYEKEKEDVDYIFKLIRKWQFPSTDLKIIKDDWEKIISKIKEGKAHEISEGDTFYLGACTKGANKDSVRTQPFSSEKAMQRAFSLKSKYLNFIIEKGFAKEEITIDQKEYDKILDDGIVNIEEPYEEYKKLNLQEVEPVIKNIEDYKKGETFEEFIIKKFEPFYGMSENEIISSLNIEATDSKSKFYLISKAILGVTKNKIEEFEKADVQMKTIRLEKSGTIKESMSFAQIQFSEIVNEAWDESYWYYMLTKRFFFVVFQKDESDELNLKKVFFWTMPPQDLEIAKDFWMDTKQKIINDDYENFIKISDNKICHVRPKGNDSSDLMETPSGRMEKKKCYWLNSSYIKKIIE